MVDRTGRTLEPPVPESAPRTSSMDYWIGMEGREKGSGRILERVDYGTRRVTLVMTLDTCLVWKINIFWKSVKQVLMSGRPFNSYILCTSKRVTPLYRGYRLQVLDTAKVNFRETTMITTVDQVNLGLEKGERNRNRKGTDGTQRCGRTLFFMVEVLHFTFPT